MSLLLIYNSLKKRKAWVVNGLKLWLDGKDFTNSPPSSSWTDKSGNNTIVEASGFDHTQFSGNDGFSGLRFDGTNDLFNLYYYDLPESFTLELRVNSMRFTDGAIFSNWTNSTTRSFLLTYAAGTNNTVVLKFYLRNTSDTDIFVASIPIALAVTADIAITYDYTSNICYAYKDGILVGTFNGSATKTRRTISASYTYIGCKQDTSSFGKMTLYNFLIYNRALSAQEVSQNYLNSAQPSQQSTNVITNGLRLWLDGKNFPSLNSDSWIDKSGTGNNALLSNFEFNTYSGPWGNGNVITDGNNDRVSIANTSNLPHLGSGDFTLNFTGTLDATGVYYMLMCRRLSTTSDYEFIFGINNAIAVEFKYSLDGTTTSTISFSYTFAINTIYDINIVKSGTTVSCYINNVLVGTPGTLSGTLYSSSQPQSLFASNSSGTYGNFYKGKFRRALQYNRALSLDEIITNYKSL